MQDPHLGFSKGWSLIGQRIQGFDSFSPCKITRSFLPYRFTAFVFGQYVLSMKMYIFFLLWIDNKIPKTQSKVVGSIKVAALRAGAPVLQWEWTESRSRARHLPNWVICTGMLRKHHVSAHSLLHEKINKGTKQCQLKLRLLFKYSWAPVHWGLQRDQKCIFHRPGFEMEVVMTLSYVKKKLDFSQWPWAEKH